VSQTSQSARAGVDARTTEKAALFWGDRPRDLADPGQAGHGLRCLGLGDPGCGQTSRLAVAFLTPLLSPASLGTQTTVLVWEKERYAARTQGWGLISD